MTQRSVRAGFAKDVRKLSKYETSLESAFKQKRIYTTSSDDTSTLSYVPDFVVVPDGTNASTALVLPTSYFDEDKTVTVVNKDAAEAVTVGGVSCAALAKTTIYFNGTAWTALFSEPNASLT